MHLTSRLFLAAATAATVVVCTVPAAAADKPRAAASAPKSKDPIMSQAELRQCMSQKDKLGQRSDAALKTEAELDRMAAENAALQATVDRTKKEEVDDYNAKVVARNALVADYQARAATYNKEAEEIQASQAAYSSACANRRYDDRDLADIRRAKK